MRNWESRVAETLMRIIKNSIVSLTLLTFNQPLAYITPRISQVQEIGLSIWSSLHSIIRSLTMPLSTLVKKCSIMLRPLSQTGSSLSPYLAAP